MKRILPYILLFISGIALGVMLFSGNNYFGISAIFDKPLENNYLAVDKPTYKQKADFVQSAIPMLGKEIIVNGTILESYKSKKNELVLYVSVSNIPFVVSCTLENTDMQIFNPIKLGEMFSIKGEFTEINERMQLKKCLVLRRETDEGDV